MPEINDIDIYNTRMTRGIVDKMFFIDKIDDETQYIVDYGCADAALIKVLAPMFPNTCFIGYDNNPEMFQRAQEQLANIQNAVMVSSLKNCEQIPGFAYEKAALLMSSIIHEIYSYSTGSEINEFWNYVNNSNYRYLIVRDMCLSEDSIRATNTDDLMRLRAGNMNDKIVDFEAIHDSIERNYNFIHFLLKYKYTENWQREVNENYLPLTLKGFLGQFSNDYILEYHDHYTLPYLRKTVMKDFGIYINDPTHIKLIYKNKKYI